MESKHKFKPDPEYRLMDQVRVVLRYHHYAYKTEQAYCSWILRYIRFYGDKTHPESLDKNNVERFLSHLATKRHVAAATQKLVLNALIFLYKQVLDINPGDGIAPVRSERRLNPPAVFTQVEVAKALDHIKDTHALMAKLLYGGLRITECIRLRVWDVDFSQGQIFIRNSKGGKDRSVMLPDAIKKELQKQIEDIVALHEKDLGEGFGEVYIPEALARKYPDASKDSAWQYVFPSKNCLKIRAPGKRCVIIMNAPNFS